MLKLIRHFTNSDPGRAVPAPSDEMTFERAEAAYYSVGHVAYPAGRVHRAVPSHICQASASLDHLVGAGEQRLWHLNADRLSGL